MHGASLKVTPGSGEPEADAGAPEETSTAALFQPISPPPAVSPDPAEATEPTPPTQPVRQPEAEAKAEAEATSEPEPEPEPEPPAKPRPKLPVDELVSSDLVADGLALAVGAVELAVAVVERSTGLILWSSATWIERFGERDLLARHMPSTTEFGESPLPPAGESWRRTRTVTFADGAEDLVDLFLIGAENEDGVEYATVVALDRAGAGPVVSDRAEVIGIVDGAIEEAAEGSVAVLYVDLDRFKVVHDLVGNIEALRLLDLVTRRISATVRGSDLVFRLPSDEFLIVACELESPEGAEDLAERLRVGVATLADVGNDMALTASIGIAVADGEQTGDQLVAAAETAVYLAKGRGRNRIAVHDEELRTRTQRLLVVERQLRRAIERRDVRFAYQPVVEIKTGKVVGAEALLRLGGDVGLSAVEVVAAAEHSGLMGVLGALVLEGVDEQLGEVLRSRDGDHMVMVNLSAAQLADESLLHALAGLTADDSIRPGRLSLEVPETVLRDHREAFVRLTKLVQPRFELGVDGFGTSADSFELLKGLPIDYVKLHRSMTAAIGQDDHERERLAAVIEQARVAQVGVVALGVERPDQVRALRAVGCRMAQGFLYAGAVTSIELLDLLDAGFPEAVESPRA